MKSTSPKRFSALAAMIPTLGLAATATLVSMSGCDTVARLTFPDLKFASVQSSGLIPAAGSCDGSTGPAKLRMVLLDTQNQPITPETTLTGTSVNLTRDSVELSSSALFEMPDVLCAGSCDNTAATCGTASPGFETALNRCFVSEGLGVNSDPTFVSDLVKNQLFGVVIENTGSLSGSLPSSFGMLYPDLNGDGKGQQVVELLSQRPERATDSSRRRASAFGRLVTNWELAQADATSRTVETYFGAWSFAGSQASLQSLVTGVWTTTGSAARAGISKVSGTPEKQQASVFESTARVLSDATGFADPRFADYEKTLVLFVDGPDELRLKGQTAQTVIDAANATNTRVFVVHIDPKIALETSGGNPLIVDDPAYVAAQDGCADDSECKNFEECRQSMRFSSNPGQNVSTPSDERAALNFCLPKRDENGRLGPVDDYAQIACATGGGYIYLSNTESLADQIDWLPFAMDGLWEVDVNIDAISRQSVAPSEPYLVQTTLQVRVDGEAKTSVYSQKGSDVAQDNRMVIFAK